MATLKEHYGGAYPFPHLVIDNYFPEKKVKQLEQDFPVVDEEKWWKYNNALEKKFAFDKLDQMPDSIKSFVYELNGPDFLRTLEDITGISGLIPDTTLRGGGLHAIKRGGKLDVHIDYNIHPETKLHRRLNVILYLNSEWSSHWGGALELWDKDMRQCYQRIDPLFNRMVIFSTSEISNHGHPDPLLCPEHITRKSIALYYYTQDRPEHEKVPAHSTVFKKRPQDSADPEIEDLRRLRSRGRIVSPSPEVNQ